MIESPAQCGIYNIITQADGAVLIVNGWAVDPLACDVADSVLVVIDGTAYPACYGLQRFDVAKVFRNLDFLCSGFRCPISVKDIGPGRHSLVLKVRSHDRTAVYEISEQFEIDPKLECVMRHESRRL